MEVALVQSDSTAKRAKGLAAMCTLAPVAIFLVSNAVLFYLCSVFHFGMAIRVVYGFNTLVMPGVLFATAGLLTWGFRGYPYAPRLKSAATI